MLSALGLPEQTPGTDETALITLYDLPFGPRSHNAIAPKSHRGSLTCPLRSLPLDLREGAGAAKYRSASESSRRGEYSLSCLFYDPPAILHSSVLFEAWAEVAGLGG